MKRNAWVVGLGLTACCLLGLAIGSDSFGGSGASVASLWGGGDPPPTPPPPVPPDPPPGAVFNCVQNICDTQCPVVSACTKDLGVCKMVTAPVNQRCTTGNTLITCNTAPANSGCRKRYENPCGPETTVCDTVLEDCGVALKCQ